MATYSYRGIEYQSHFQKGGMGLDYSFTIDGVDITKEIAKKLFDEIEQTGADAVSTDCPLAALQIDIDLVPQRAVVVFLGKIAHRQHAIARTLIRIK